MNNPAPGVRRSLFWRIWLRSVNLKRPQAALAVGSLLVGAAIASLLLNLYGEVRRKMSQEVRAYGANILLAPRGEFSASTNSLSGFIPQYDLAGLEDFRKRNPGFDDAPVLYAVLRVARVSGDARLPEFVNAVAVGADFSALQRLSSGWHLRGESRPSGSKQCTVGERLAARLKLRLGDSIELSEVAPTGKAGERQSFRVSSVVSTGASEDDQVFVPLAALQRLAGVQGKISLVEISAPGETREVERTVRALSRAFAGLDVRPIRQIVYSEGKILDTIRSLLVSLTALTVIIIALCVMATMTAIVLERRRDIAVMKALGASDGAVMRLFLSEGAGLGAAGGVLGFFLGAWAARVLGERLFGAALGVVWINLPLVSLASTMLATFATLFPVRMIRRIQPAVALKGD